MRLGAAIVGSLIAGLGAWEAFSFGVGMIVLGGCIFIYAVTAKQE